ncbi:MAG TPA: hypothetical protein VFM29_01480 [Vicinamibacteria bacterium]|nr:hypothetical protein [Vicinamibacteria bacterium]
MKFPGSKLLHHWDLPTPNLSLVDLLKSCQQVGLTGFAEVKTSQAVAMIMYYQGGEVNALYREGALAFNGMAALDRLRELPLTTEGTLSVFELPLDLAHLLRGITKRQKLRETLKGHEQLAEFLQRMEKAEHTGTIEVQNSMGSAMILIVRGRVSNMYWEASGGTTFEGGEARKRLERSLDKEESMIFLSEFSRDVWKTRHEVQTAVVSRLARREEGAQAEEVVSEEIQLRRQVLDELITEWPAIVQAFMFDVLTGAVYVRRAGKGSSLLKIGLLAEKIPNLTQVVRDMITLEDKDELEIVQVTTDRVAMLVAMVPHAAEAIAVVAEKAQPTQLIGAALLRRARSYADRLHPARGVV